MSPGKQWVSEYQERITEEIARCNEARKPLSETNTWKEGYYQGRMIALEEVLTQLGFLKVAL